MTEDKNAFMNILYKSIDKVKLKDNDGVELSIDNFLTPQQKYQILLTIVADFPKNDVECVLDFHDKFKVEKEDTHVVTDFKYSELRFNLILEEVLELGKALGFSNHRLYDLILSQYQKILVKPVETSLTEVLDALTNILFVTHGAIDAFNLTPIQHKAMLEVYKSNMSKLVESNVPNVQEILKDTISSYKGKGIEVVSVDLKNNYIAICDRDTDKILKPVTYTKPDLETIVNTHLKQK